MDRSKCTLSQEIIDLFVDQMVHEMKNYFIYRQFASYYNSVAGLPNLHEYYTKRSDEEYKHFLHIYDYLVYNDAVFEFKPVDPIKVEIADNMFPLTKTVDVEIDTTLLLWNIYRKAMESNDYRTMSKLFEFLIPEQEEEEATSRTAVSIAEQGKDWLIIQENILELLEN